MKTESTLEVILKKEKKVLILGLSILFLLLILGYRFYDNLRDKYLIDEQSNGQPSDVSPIGLSDGVFVVGGGSDSTNIFQNTPTVVNNTLKINSKIPLLKWTSNGKKFQSFKYSQLGPQILDIFDKCSAEYYTILIFNTKDDYVKNPNTSKYNSAFSCPASRSFSQKIDISLLNLNDGDSYYIIVADQSSSGSWYNAR